MQNKVQIISDEMGNVIRVSNTNPEYAHIRLSQDRAVLNNGFISKKSVTTLLHGKLEDLRDMGMANKTELTGKIIVKEQLTPFSNNDPDRDLKIAGDTGIICCVHGEPIYRKTVFTYDVTAEDVLLDHTNGDAIKEANGGKYTGNKIATATVQQAFDIESTTDQLDSNDDIIEEVEMEVEDSTFEL